MSAHRQRVRRSHTGVRLRFRLPGWQGQGTLEELRGCSRPSTAVDKALGEAIQAAAAAGTPRHEIGQVLELAEDAASRQDVIDALAESRRGLWRPFPGTP